MKHLLDAAEENQVPVVLLDLKEPANLSALDAMAVLWQIDALAKNGLLILPENDASYFGLPVSFLAYNQTTGEFQFAYLEDVTQLYHPLFSDSAYIPIAAETDATQPTPDGPSLEVRRALLETAFNGDEDDILVLGGSLANSTWASPNMVGATMAYFASRPYIRILTEADLIQFPTKYGNPLLQPFPLDGGTEKLKVLYQNMTQPVLDFAEKWTGSPLFNCATDIDNDNKPECILANEQYLAILDPQGARLTYLFTRNGASLHQLIGPSWQVAVGLSAPSLWDVSAVAEVANPGAYPGAFADADDPFQPYEPTIEGDSLVFTSLDGARKKIFSLTDDGLEVEYLTQEPVTTQIPLLVDPWTRFTPGWAKEYTQQNTPRRNRLGARERADGQDTG